MLKGVNIINVVSVPREILPYVNGDWLVIGSTATATDLVAKWLDQHPKGKAILVDVSAGALAKLLRKSKAFQARGYAVHKMGDVIELLRQEGAIT